MLLFKKMLFNFVVIEGNKFNMRKEPFLIVFLSVIFAAGALAQQDTTRQDSVQVQNRGARKKSAITLIKDQVLGTNYWEEEFKGNWAGIFVGINGLAKTDYSMYAEAEQDFFEPEPLQSYVLNINLIQFSQGLQRSRNTIGLITGIGLEFQSWHLADATGISKGTSRIQPVKLDYDNPRKSKLTSSFLSVPVLIEFQIPMKEYGNRIYFSTGLIISKRLSTHTKIKYTHQEKDFKLKSADDYYLRDFRSTATVRCGYRWINVFAGYDLHSLFMTDKGPKAYPYSVGLALISF